MADLLGKTMEMPVDLQCKTLRSGWHEDGDFIITLFCFCEGDHPMAFIKMPPDLARTAIADLWGAVNGQGQWQNSPPLN